MLRQVSGLGTWSLSSYKQGQGLDQLRSNDLKSYWQSDGPQPHFINISFKHKLYLSRCDIYLDYEQDESCKLFPLKKRYTKTTFDKSRKHAQ